MKKVYIFILLIVSFFIVNEVSAASVTARAYINSSCNVRTGPGTQNKAVTSAYIGSYYNLVEDKTYEDTNNHYNCNSDWYQIYYNGVATGYVCGDHVDVVRSYSSDDVAPQTTCEIEMSNLGFPSSYWGGLCALKEKYSNWNFVALKTNTDWSVAVEEESDCGKNLIYGSEANQGFIDTSCSAYDSGYVGILPKGIAYYMDPRNYLSDRFIFQFQHLAYEDKFLSYYPVGVSSIISGAEFYKYHLGLNNNLSDIVTNVGKELNVSPIFTSARMIQELGSQTTLYNLYSGVYTGLENAYYGYYNFFNIGVSDSCVQQYGTAYCGLNHAKTKGWNTVPLAIKGGMELLSNNYINRGQYTMYLQKFNVLNSAYNHQYMTNVAAPSSESATTYKTYSDLGIMNSNFIFYIPVYNNMEATINNSNQGAVDSGDGNNPAPSTIPIHTIVTSSGYRYSSSYISNIAPGTDVATLKGVLESVAGNATVMITNKDGSAVFEGIIGTGYKVSINNQSTTEVLEVVIKGDTSGDGVINALDLLQVQKNILGTYSLTGAYSQAGDTSGDGNINALDLLQVQKSILGTYTIVQ